MEVVIARYKNALQMAGGLDPKTSGAEKTVLLGVLVRLENGEAVPAEEFKGLVGDEMYFALVEDVGVIPTVCLLAEVEWAEEPRIQSPVPTPINGRS